MYCILYMLLKVVMYNNDKEVLYFKKISTPKGPFIISTGGGAGS